MRGRMLFLIEIGRTPPLKFLRKAFSFRLASSPPTPSSGIPLQNTQRFFFSRGNSFLLPLSEGPCSAFQLSFLRLLPRHGGLDLLRQGGFLPTPLPPEKGPRPFFPPLTSSFFSGPFPRPAPPSPPGKTALDWFHSYSENVVPFISNVMALSYDFFTRKADFPPFRKRYT